jgi:hypothetical protein
MDDLYLIFRLLFSEVAAAADSILGPLMDLLDGRWLPIFYRPMMFVQASTREFTILC